MDNLTDIRIKTLCALIDVQQNKALKWHRLSIFFDTGLKLSLVVVLINLFFQIPAVSLTCISVTTIALIGFVISTRKIDETIDRTSDLLDELKRLT